MSGIIITDFFEGKHEQNRFGDRLRIPLTIDPEPIVL
jgi:hypothetical protein